MGRKKKNRRDAGKRGLPRFLRILLWVCGAVLACALLLGGIYTIRARSYYEVSFYQETSRKVSENLRIIQLSDLHSREFDADNEKLLREIRTLKPDLILLTGDMINRGDKDYSPVLAFCRKLCEIAPVYAVYGNHENERIYGNGEKDLPSKFRDTGVHMLLNESETVEIGKNRVQIIGIDGTEYGFEEYGARKFMNGLKMDPGAYSIVMAHYPILFKRQLQDYQFDLGLAGHVHGGLIRIPFAGGLYSAEEGFFPTYSGGKYLLGNGSAFIVSRGLGDSGWVPRINNLPELVVIDVNWC